MGTNTEYGRAHYKANREAYIERAKAAYRKDPEAKHEYDRLRRNGESRDAVLSAQKAKRDRNRGSQWEIWNRAKWRAKRHNIQFTIKVSDVVVPTHCPVFGIQLVAVNTRGGHKASPSLDRIDPRKGYVPGNVVVISKHANAIKTNADLSEILMVARWLQQLHSAN